jgi:hypothetical protein
MARCNNGLRHDPLWTFSGRVTVISPTRAGTPWDRTQSVSVSSSPLTWVGGQPIAIATQGITPRKVSGRQTAVNRTRAYTAQVARHPPRIASFAVEAAQTHDPPPGAAERDVIEHGGEVAQDADCDLDLSLLAVSPVMAIEPGIQTTSTPPSPQLLSNVSGRHVHYGEPPGAWRRTVTSRINASCTQSGPAFLCTEAG